MENKMHVHQVRPESKWEPTKGAHSQELKDDADIDAAAIIIQAKALSQAIDASMISHAPATIHHHNDTYTRVPSHNEMQCMGR